MNIILRQWSGQNAGLSGAEENILNIVMTWVIGRICTASCRVGAGKISGDRRRETWQRWKSTG